MFPLGVRGRTWFGFTTKWFLISLKNENKFFQAPPRTNIWIPGVQQMSECSNMFESYSHFLLCVTFFSFFFLLLMFFILFLLLLLFSCVVSFLLFPWLYFVFMAWSVFLFVVLLLIYVCSPCYFCFFPCCSSRLFFFIVCLLHLNAKNNKQPTTKYKHWE